MIDSGATRFKNQEEREEGPIWRSGLLEKVLVFGEA